MTQQAQKVIGAFVGELLKGVYTRVLRIIDGDEWFAPAFIVTVCAVYAEQILYDSNALFRVCERVYADAIGFMFQETGWLFCGTKCFSHVVGLANINRVMAGGVVGAVAVSAFGDEIHRGHWFEPCPHGPYLEAVRFARCPGETDVARSRGPRSGCVGRCWPLSHVPSGQFLLG